MRYVTKNDIFTIGHYLGLIMQGVGVVVALPIFVALIYGEHEITNFLIPSIFSVFFGFILYRQFNKYSKLKLKQAMVVSSLAWLWAAFIGALVLVLAFNLSFIDALFENMSAWTGSGFTFFNNVEILPYSILFLRSLEQWVGGLGIIVMLVGILVKKGNHLNKFYLAEAREDRIKPSMRNTLKKTFTIYLIYTIFGIVAYIIVGLPIFDSINLTFTTIATGGMSIKNANVGFYHNNLVYIITMILMILGGTSFAVHSKVIKTKGKAILKDIQFRSIILLIFVVSILIYLVSNSVPMDMLFHVVSAITTTGANVAPTEEFLSWHGTSIVLLFVLMFIGGSSGSTSGGVKLLRTIISLKTIKNQLRAIIYPQGVKKQMVVSNRLITEKEIQNASSFIVLSFLLIAIVWFLLILYGYNPLNSLFDTISAQSNTGLSTGVISNTLPGFIKLVLIIQMWMGRLEIIPVLVLFAGLYELFKFKPKNKKSIKNKTKSKKPKTPKKNNPKKQNSAFKHMRHKKPYEYFNLGVDDDSNLDNNISDGKSKSTDSKVDD